MSFKQFTATALGMSQVTPAFIIKQICSTSTTAGSSSVSFVDYLTFWNSLQRTQSQTTKLLTEVLGKIVELQRALLKRLGKLKLALPPASSTAYPAPPSTASSISSGLEEMRALWHLANMCRFIDLFLGVEHNNAALRKALKLYETHRAEFLSSSSPELYQYVLGEMDQHLARSLRGLFAEEEHHHPTTTPDSMMWRDYVDELVVMNTSAWAMMGGGNDDQDRDLAFYIHRDYSLCGLRLLSKLTQQQGQRAPYDVFALVLARLQALAPPASTSSSTAVPAAITPGTLDTVGALLFLLREAFTSYAVMDRALSRECERVAKAFVYYPAPHGPRARQLVKLIQLERAVPGQALRKRIQREHALLTPHGNALLEKYGSGQLHEWAQSSRQIIVLHNNSARSNVLRKLISRPLNKGRAGAQELHLLKEDMLVQWLECELTGGEGAASDWHNQIVAAVRNRPPQELHSVFERALLTKTSTTGNAPLETAAALGLKRAFARQQDDAFSGAGAAAPAPVVPAFAASNWPQQQIRLPNLSFDFLELAPLSGDVRRTARTVTDGDGALPMASTLGGGGGGGAKKSIVPNHRKPATRMSLSIPGLEMFATANGVDAFQNESRSCPQQYIAYTADFDELVREARSLVPPGGGNKAGADHFKPVLRRVLLGGQEVVHRAVSTYCAFLAIDPELASQIKFEFYLVPTSGRLDLACFLAQRDAWYRKHVFAPFCNHGMLYPNIKAEKDDLGLGGGGPMGGFKAPGSSFVNNRRPSFKDLKAQPPSNFDSDFAAGDVGAFDGNSHSHSHTNPENVLETLEEPGGFDKLQQQQQLSGESRKHLHKFDCVPGKLLRPLLENFVRQAQEQILVQVFDCECWESIDSIETDRSPDVTVPFVTRVELGVHCAVQQINDQLRAMQIHSAGGGDEDVLPALPLEDMLVDKTFCRAVQGGANAELRVATPELTVHMYPMGLDGQLDARAPGLELADAAYLSLTLANTPRYTWPSARAVQLEATEPPHTSSNPTAPWIEVQCVPQRTALVDAVRKKEKKPKDVEQVIDALRLEAKTHHAGYVDIRSTLSSRMPFFITVDGQVFGPYYRVRVRRSTALSTSGGQSAGGAASSDDDSPAVHFPLMCFLPVHT